MEGSALSERDLLRSRAEAATACLLLADRFSPKPEEEDLNLQFQVKNLVLLIPKPFRKPRGLQPSIPGAEPGPAHSKALQKP
jgi:hypothetical protein